MRSSLFASLPDSKLRVLMERSELITLAEGDVLFHEGDEGDALFVIVDGTMTLVAGEPEKELATMIEGEFFGEIAIVTDGPRTATARAGADSPSGARRATAGRRARRPRAPPGRSL